MIFLCNLPKMTDSRTHFVNENLTALTLLFWSDSKPVSRFRSVQETDFDWFRDFLSWSFAFLKRGNFELLSRAPPIIILPGQIFIVNQGIKVSVKGRELVHTFIGRVGYPAVSLPLSPLINKNIYPIKKIYIFYHYFVQSFLVSWAIIAAILSEFPWLISRNYQILSSKCFQRRLGFALPAHAVILSR